jgi:hypothetical protein
VWNWEGGQHVSTWAVCCMSSNMAGHDMDFSWAQFGAFSVQEKVLSPSLNCHVVWFQSLTWKTGYPTFPELSKPSIFSPSLVLMVVFDDVAAGPTCQGMALQSCFSPPPLPLLRRRLSPLLLHHHTAASSTPPRAPPCSPWPPISFTGRHPPPMDRAIANGHLIAGSASPHTTTRCTGSFAAAPASPCPAIPSRLPMPRRPSGHRDEDTTPRERRRRPGSGRSAYTCSDPCPAPAVAPNTYPRSGSGGHPTLPLPAVPELRASIVQRQGYSRLDLWKVGAAQGEQGAGRASGAWGGEEAAAW